MTSLSCVLNWNSNINKSRKSKNWLFPLQQFHPLAVTLLHKYRCISSYLLKFPSHSTFISIARDFVRIFLLKISSKRCDPWKQCDPWLKPSHISTQPFKENQSLENCFPAVYWILESILEYKSPLTKNAIHVDVQLVTVWDPLLYINTAWWKTVLY